MKNRDNLSCLAVVFALSLVLIVSGCATTDTASRNAGGGALIGTLLGAGLGAAIGAATGNPGIGAAIGAGAGALVGTTAGYAVGQNEKIMRAQGRYPPPIPSYVSSVGSPQWNGNFWFLYDPNGNVMWWNESEERWQY